jgi:hypothetical protein
VGREVQQVFAETATCNQGSLVEDTALLLTFDGELGASLDPSWSRPAMDAGQGDLTIEITGTNGVAHVDAFAQYVRSSAMTRRAASGMHGATTWTG